MNKNRILFSYGFPESSGRILVPEGRTAAEFERTFEGDSTYVSFCELARQVSTYQTPEKRIGPRTRIEEIERLGVQLEQMWTINIQTFSPANFFLTGLPNYAAYLLNPLDVGFQKHPSHRQILTKWDLRKTDGAD